MIGIASQRTINELAAEGIHEVLALISASNLGRSCSWLADSLQIQMAVAPPPFAMCA
jgi:hypothetical protein